MIKYEMITWHFTAHRCLFGWNSTVVLEKSFSLSVRACMGIRLKKNMSYHCLPDKSSQQHRNSGSTAGWRAASSRDQDRA